MRLLAVVALLVPTAVLATNVSGTLPSSTTWTAAGNPWVLTGDVTVETGVTLTIEPGVQITFALGDDRSSGASIGLTELIINGTLIVQGTSTSPASFSMTNGYGIRVLNAGTATLDYAVLDGGNYGVFNSGTATLTHSTVKWAGECLHTEARILSFEQGTLQNCGQALLTNGGSTLLRYSVVTASGSLNKYAITLNAPAQIIHDTITANITGAIRVNAFTGVVNLSDNIITSNDTQGVSFASTTPSRTVQYNNVWGHSSFDYTFNVTPGPGSISANPLYVGAPNFRITEYSPARMAASDGTDLGALAYTGDPSPAFMGVLFADKTLTGATTLAGDMTVRPGVTLTLAPGSTLTFAATDGLRAGINTAEAELIVDGTLNAQGTSTTPATLTATGAYGVRVLGSATFDYATVNGGLWGVVSSGTSVFTHSTLQGSSGTCLSVSGGNTTFRSGTLQNCSFALGTSGGMTDFRDSLVRTSGATTGSRYAIFLQGSATLAHNTITGNNFGGVQLASFSGTVELADNIITSNGANGVTANSTTLPTRSVHHNDIWGHTTQNTNANLTLGPGSISANPLFVSASDFHLTEYSPARLAASDGTDMGAFAYEGVPTPTLQGVLSSDLTLTGANTLAGDLTVRTGVTLTLAPGASLTFATTDGLRSGVDTARTELIVDGTLDVQGTSTSPVALTATGAYGVRVQGSATLHYTTVDAGLFGVVSSGTSSLDHSTLQGASTECLRVTGGTTSFSHGTLQSCGQALVTTGGATDLTYSVVRTSGSTTGSRSAISLSAPANLSHDTITGNNYGAIQVTNFSGTVNLFDNVVATNGTQGINFANATTPARSVHHNDVWDHTTNYNTNVTPGAGSFSAHPLFVSASDFHPTEYSPARLMASDGTDLGAFTYTGAPTSGLLGAIVSDLTLTGANTLAGDLIVRPGATLTLAPGASLTFPTSDGLRSGVDTARTELIVDGTLDVQGTSSTPVALTATGAYGVRVQGSATVRYATVNAGLYGVVSSGASTLEHSTLQGATTECLRVTGGTTAFSYGTLKNCSQALVATGGSTDLRYSVVTASGSSSGARFALDFTAPATLVHNTLVGNNYGAVHLNVFSGVVEIFDNIIASNGTYGLYFLDTSTPTRSIHHNDIWSNSVLSASPGPGSISANPLLVSASDFHPTEYSPARLAASDGTDMGALAYEGAPTPTLQGALSSDLTLTGANTLAGDLTVRTGVTLTLAPGASLTFATTDGLRSGVDIAKTELIVDGSLDVQGTSSAPVAFTATGAYGVRVQGSATLHYTTVDGGLFGVSSSGTSTLDHSTLQGATTQCLLVTGGTTSFSYGTLQNCTQALRTDGGTTDLRYSLVRKSGAASGLKYAIDLFATATLVHNTLVDNPYTALNIRDNAPFAAIYDNIISSRGNQGFSSSGLVNPRSIHHNDVWNSGVVFNPSVPLGAGGISANPLFVSDTDFRLTEYSPARQMASDGTDMGAFTYEGHPSPGLLGALVSDVTLTGANTLIGDLTVRPGATLTLAPGASLTFAATDQLGSGSDATKTELSIDGALVAQGSSEAPITLTATGALGVRVQGSATFDYATVTAGQFGVISSGASTFTNSTIQGASTECLQVRGGTTSFSHGTLQNCVRALFAFGGTTSLSLEYSLVRSNGSRSSGAYAIELGASASLVHNTLTGNNQGAIRVSTFLGDITVADNIITSNDLFGLSFNSSTAPSRSVHHNDVWGHSTADYNANITPGPGSISSDPLFVGAPDFSLLATSPCRNAASDGLDMGAFPYVPVLASYVVVTPSAQALPVLGTQQFTATAYDASDRALPGAVITWSALGAAGTVSPSGLFMAGCAPGSYAGAVTASVDGQSSSAAVTILPGPAASVTVLPAAVTLAPQDTQQFTATVADTCNNVLPLDPVDWLVIAGGGEISPSGLFTAGTAAGTFDGTVTATSGAVSGTATVTVTPGALASIEVTPTASTLGIHESQLFTAVGRDSAGNIVPVSVAWSVVSGGGTVDAAGVFTAGTMPGTYVNTVRASSGSVSGFATVTVQPGALASIEVTPGTAALSIHESQLFTAVGKDSAGNTVPVSVTWTVVNGGGTVDPAGMFTAGTTPGTYANTVRASSGSVSGFATVTVQPGALASIEVAPGTATVSIHETQLFAAVGKDSAGNTVPVSVTWSVVNGGGAVDPAGMFTAGATPGAYANTVRASSGSISGFASVTVQPGALASIEVAPNTATLPIHGTRLFTAIGKDSAGNTVPVSVTWSVVNGGGSIDAMGLFTADTTPGTYADTVRAFSDSVSGFASVTVQPGALASLEVTPSTATMTIHGTQAFTAIGKDSAGNTVPASVTWSVVNGGGTIDATGLFTAGTTPGTYANTVRASSGSISSAATISIQPGALASIEITPNTAALSIHESQLFTAVGKDSAGNTVPVSVTWSVLNGGGTVDPAGMFTAGATPGTYANTVQASSGSISGFASVTVQPGALASIEVAPNTTTLPIHGTQAFTAIGKDSAGNIVPVSVTWSVVNGGGSVDATGLFTAGTTPGTYANTVRASSGSVSGFATVTVQPGALASIEVTPNTVVLSIHDTQLFTAVGKDSAGNIVPVSVTWSVVNGGGTVDPAGMFTAGTAPGTYASTIRASSGSISGFASITVQPGALANIEVTPNPAVLSIHDTQLFTAVGKDSAGNTLPISVTWSVVSGGGSIDAAGMFTAGTTPGTYSNTVRASSGSVSGFASVTVQPGALASIEVAPSTATLPIHGTQAFTAVGKDSAGNTVPVSATWSVVNGGGTIDATGLFTAGTAPGTYANTVRASSGSISGAATVTVQPGALASIEMTPNTATLSIQGTQLFTAIGKDSAGNTVPASVTWSVINGGGSIDATGLFTAGTVAGTFTQTIQATSGALSATASITVNPGPVHTVEVTPSSATLRVHGTRQFTATATDAWGNPVSGTPVWSVSASTVGSMDATGLLTAGSRAGTYPAAVMAQLDGVSGSADVIVTPGDLTRIVVTPALIHVGPSDAQQFSATGEDADGNIVSISPTWSVLPGAGTITPEGLFTAPQLPGSYPESVIATTNGLTGTASVVVDAGAIHRVVISPQDPTVVIQGTIAFSAKAYDAFDNELPITPTWEIVSGGGTLDTSGLFTAGLQSGTFANTIRVTVDGLSASTSVTVATDFDDDGMSDAWEVAHGFDPSTPGDGALDADGDQLTNLTEFQAGTDPHDADTDDDGVRDGRELRPTEDVDGDGLPNVRDPDSDNDGLFDGTEMAVSAPPEGTDVSQQKFVADSDPSTSTGPLTADTDGDGRKDGAEDANHNGRIDPGETDPNTPETFCSATPECGSGKACQEGVCMDAPEAPGDEKSGGCGCSGSGAGASLLSLLLLSFLLRARRRDSV